MNQTSVGKGPFETPVPKPTERKPRDPVVVQNDAMAQDQPAPGLAVGRYSLSPAAQGLVALAHQRGQNSLLNVPRHLWAKAMQDSEAKITADWMRRAQISIGELTAQNITLNKANTSLTKENETLKSENASLKAKANTSETLAHEKAALKDQNAELKKGLDAMRTALDLAYPSRQIIALPLRVEGLGKERDMWKERALKAEASARNQTRAVPYSGTPEVKP